MTSIISLSAGFIFCSLVIVFSGTRLSIYGNIIAELTGMGKAWMGLILMAAVTSLPELFTGISSIVLMDSPDIAVGDVMGSCAFNLVILAILDFFVPGKPLSSVVTKSHVLAGFFGILLITLSVIEIIFGSILRNIGWLISFPVLLIALYLIAIRVIFENERHLSLTTTHELVSNIRHKHENISLKLAIKRYILYAMTVITAAILLPYFADNLATSTGISKSFIGTLLVAASTSLPELVVSIAAVRIGSMDMAVGNLLGSNIFNMLILAFDDLLYTKGPLLLASNPNHALSGLVTLLMTGVVGISILYGSPSKRFVLGIDAIILIVLYLALISALYFMG